MQKSDVTNLLEDFNKQEVDTYASYVLSLQLAKDRSTGQPKNPWAIRIPAAKWAAFYKRVAAEGLVIDGKNITIDTRGVSYNWVAYKNKMLIAYPDSSIDVQLVYEGDEFECSKQSGVVEYSHKIAKPFEQKDDDLVGGYCVMKNKRGEFLTTMGKADVMKHRQIAKTKKIWDQWFKEMVMKTIIKKACSQHFRDIVQKMEDEDNERYDLDLLDAGKADDLLAKAKEDNDK